MLNRERHVRLYANTPPLENVTAGYPPGQMFLLASQKGSRKLDRPPRKRGSRARRRGISRELDCILVARERSGQAIDAVTGRGALSAAQLTQHLLPTLDPDALLVSDANAAYRVFAGKHRIAHQGSSCAPVNGCA